jgi:SAM-dependent methyltransferase
MSSRTVCVLLDHPTLDAMLVPVIEVLLAHQVEVIPLVCNAGKADLLVHRGIPYASDPSAFGDFTRRDGRKLFLNAADQHFDAHALGRHLDTLCRERGIPSLTLEHGPFSLVENFSEQYLFDADMMALFGSIDCDRYRSHGVPPERLVITGCPKYDAYYHLDKSTAVREIRHLLEIPPGKGYILFAGQNNKFKDLGIPEAVWVETLTAVYRELLEHFPKLSLIVKPHPAEPHYETTHLYAEASIPEFEDRIRIIDAYASLPHLILGSTFVFSFSSSVTLESLILKKPVVFCSGKIKNRAILDCANHGARILQPEWSEIPAALHEIIPQLKSEGWRNVRITEQFIRRYLHQWDGRAAQRVGWLMETILSGKPVKLQMGIMTEWNNRSGGQRKVAEDLSFERYQRLMGIAEEVPPACSLLDVGSEDTCLKKLLPDIQYASYNGIVTSRDLRLLPYADNSFDVVVASDVLEHVIPTDRRLFLYELLRVAGSRVVFSFPGELSAEAEALILSIIPENRWLKQHRQQGLPRREDLEALLNELGLHYKSKSNTPLATWVYSVLYDYISLTDQQKQQLNTFFQARCYDTSSRGPAYRSIYTVHIPQGAEKAILRCRIGNYLKRIRGEALPQFSIVIPVADQDESLQCCLAGLIENTLEESFEVIIVDNDSSDGTQDFIASLEGDLKVIGNETNVGFAWACNQGAQAACGEYLVFMDPEVVPQKAWLGDMLALMTGKVGVVTRDLRCDGKKGEVILIRKDLFETFKGFDEQGQRGLLEKVQASGRTWQDMVLRDCTGHGWGAKDNRKRRLTDPELAELFGGKMEWGKWSPDSGHTRNAIFDFLLEASHACSDDTVVLDVSAGQCRYKPFFQHARYIAIDSRVGDQSWDYHTLNIVGDALALPIRSSSIDICTNFTSLEHYTEPMRAFVEFARVLKPGGKLFLYVPFAIGEHQIPHDYYRYTRYALARFCRENDLDVEYLRPVNSIFETAMGVLRQSIGYVSEPEMKGLLGRIQEDLDPLLRELESAYASLGSAEYPMESALEQFPRAYCLCAAKREQAHESTVEPENPAKSPGGTLVGQLAELRRKFGYGEALQTLSHSGSIDVHDSTLINEIIRILLLAEQYDVARKHIAFFQKYATQGRCLDEEIVLRLELALPDLSLEGIAITPTGFGWVKRYREERLDPEYAPDLKRIEIINDARSFYYFTAHCASCGQEYTLEVRGTLLVKKTYLCPLCLARQCLHFGAIQAFIRRVHPDLLIPEVERYNQRNRELRTSLNRFHGDEAFPWLVRAMNQDAIFALNQLLIRELFTQESGA